MSYGECLHQLPKNPTLHPLNSAIILARAAKSTKVYSHEVPGSLGNGVAYWNGHARRLISEVVVDELHKRPQAIQQQLNWQNLTTLAEIAVGNEAARLLNLVFKEVGSPLAKYVADSTPEDALATFAAGQYSYYGSSDASTRWILPRDVEKRIEQTYGYLKAFEISNNVRNAVSFGIRNLIPQLHAEIDRIIRSAVPSIADMNGAGLVTYALVLAKEGKHEGAGIAYLQLARTLQLGRDEAQSGNDEVMALGLAYHSAALEFLLAGNREMADVCMEGIFHRANAYRNAMQPYQAALISTYLVDLQSEIIKIDSAGARDPSSVPAKDIENMIHYLMQLSADLEKSGKFTLAAKFKMQEGWMTLKFIEKDPERCAVTEILSQKAQALFIRGGMDKTAASLHVYTHIYCSDVEFPMLIDLASLTNMN